MNQQTNTYTSDDWIKTFNILKENILRSVHSVKLAVVKTINFVNDTMTLFDLNNDELVYSSCILTSTAKSKTITVGDIVLVLFTDIDYLDNYLLYKEAQKINKSTILKNKHSINNGIILDLVYAKRGIS